MIANSDCMQGQIFLSLPIDMCISSTDKTARLIDHQCIASVEHYPAPECAEAPDKPSFYIYCCDDFQLLAEDKASHIVGMLVCS